MTLLDVEMEEGLPDRSSVLNIWSLLDQTLKKEILIIIIDDGE